MKIRINKICLSIIVSIICLASGILYSYLTCSLAVSNPDKIVVVIGIISGIILPVIISLYRGKINWDKLSLSLLPFGSLIIMVADFLSGSPPDYVTARFIVCLTSVLTVVIALVLRFYREQSSARVAVPVLITLIAIYIGCFLWVNIRMYNLFIFGGRDSTLTIQNIWTILHGKMFYTTSNRCYHFAQHFQPFLFIMALPYLVWSSPLSLFISRVIFLGLGAIPLYLIARRHLSAFAALAIPIIFFFHPVIYTSQVSNILPINYTPFFLFFVILYFLQRKFFLFLVFSVLTMGIRDEYCLMWVIFGLIALIRRYPLKWGIISLAVGLAWFLLETKFIYPYFSQLSGGYYVGAGIYHAPWKHFGDNLFQVIISPFTDPNLWVREILNPVKLKIFITSLLPIGCFTFLFSSIWLIGVPSILIILMIIPEGTESYTVLTHDVPYIMPLVVAAMASLPFGLKRLSDISSSRLKLNIIPGVLIFSISLSVLIAFRSDLFENLVLGGIFESNFTKSSPQDLAGAISIIPRNDRVVAPRYIAYKLAESYYVNIPEGPLAQDNFSYVVVDWNTTHRPTKIAFEDPAQKSSPEYAVQKILAEPGTREREAVFWKKLISQETFKKVYSKNGVEVYKRKP